MVATINQKQKALPAQAGSAMAKGEVRVRETLNVQWTDERPSEPGEYWLSIEPYKRGSNPDPSKPTRPNRSVMPVVIEMASGSYWEDDNGLTVYFDRRGFGTGWIGKLDRGFFDGAKWSRRETPADPFEEEKR